MTDQDGWRGHVTHQIYLRSFMDSNGDGAGDLPGITARLSCVASLGVDAVRLSPVFTSPRPYRLPRHPHPGQRLPQGRLPSPALRRFT